MATPKNIRSTAGFRHLVLFELDSSGLPVGTATLEASAPYTITSGSVISGSSASVPAGTTVSGSIPYYGIKHSGAKVLTLNDPTPRVLPHVGDDGVFSLQVLPPLESLTGEVHVDKTNDMVDAVVSAVKKVVIGETNFFGQSTSQRGFENSVGALAYSAAQDTDPDSSAFGTTLWDFRIFPKVNVYMRDTGYGQEVNERVYSFTPMYCTAYIWGVQFTVATEGFTRAQLMRGVGSGKPALVAWKGDGTTLGFPFDSGRPAASTAKMTVWKNGALLSSGYTATVRGIGFSVAPLVTDVLICYYEW